MRTIAFFNPAGGSGKTSLVFHLAWMLADMGKKVLAADFDPQSTLTSMFLDDEALDQLWNPGSGEAQTVVAPLHPILEGLDDVGTTPLLEIAENLWLIPGDLELSRFEASLSDAWPRCLDHQETAFRATGALHKIARQGAAMAEADYVLLDVGPNVGALNRAALLSADGVVIPVVPDLFSLQGLRNLGPALREWRADWQKRLRDNKALCPEVPKGDLSPLGYVVAQFGLRENRPLHSCQPWARRIPSAYSESVLGIPAPRLVDGAMDPNCLGLLKHYRSLFSISMEVRKPLFHLKAADGAVGSHAASVRQAESDFEALANRIMRAVASPTPTSSTPVSP